MATAFASRPELATTLAAVLAAAVGAFTHPAVHAATLTAPDCAASDDIACHLTGVLHVLYILAAILALVLLAVIALAVRIYHKNKVEDEQRRP